MMKIYEDNALEKPAYAEQRKFIKQVLNGRPGLKASILQAHSSIDAKANC